MKTKTRFRNLDNRLQATRKGLIFRGKNSDLRVRLSALAAAFPEAKISDVLADPERFGLR